jgi:NAD(P)-dependent dehydrogenase (short-subunit alcohol dehydrogenase family)
VTEVLRPGVLAGVRMAVAGNGVVGDAVAARALALGASVGVEGELDVLVWDGTGSSGRAALDGAWDAIQPAVAGPLAGGGLLLLLAPPPGDADSEAARAGLENMARTLSIEWARRGIRPVAIHPGAATTPAEVAEVVAYLASPAGAYYSGCRFDLGLLMVE